MNPIDIAESTMQKFVFDFLDRFGASLTIVAVILILSYKVVPELAKVAIEKYRAETEMIRDMQKVVVSLPSIFTELKVALVSNSNEMKLAIITELQRHQSDGDRRIEDKVDRLSRKVAHSEPDSEPPPRSSLPSRPK